MNPHPFPQSGYTPPAAPDLRNFIYEKATPIAPFPDFYKTDISNLTQLFQGERAACVEHAITKAVMYYVYKTTGKVVTLSPRFLAALTVKADGFPLSNGTSLLNALKMAQKYGICEDSFFPNDVDLSDEEYCDLTKITPEAYANALQYKIDSYAFLSDLSSNGLNHAINQNGIVIVGMHICASWWTNIKGAISWLAADLLPLRPCAANDPTDSNHAFDLYGYDTNYKYLDNSFGLTWGNNGNGYFGANDIPEIYEACTLLFLSPEQIAKQKKASDIVQTIQSVETVENGTSDPVVKNALVALLQGLWESFLQVYSKRIE